MNKPMHRGGNVLWMGDLEAYMDGDFIGEAFRLMGEAVNCIKLVMDKYDGHKAGYCFVDMPDEQAARRTMLNVNGKVVPNTRPPVKFNLSFANNPNAGATEYNLFVNNLPLEIGDAELYQIFGHSYVSCRGAKVYKNADGTNRGSGFVRFNDETDQQRAFIEMHRKQVFGRPMLLKLAPVRTKRAKPGPGGAGPEYEPAQHYARNQDFYNSQQWRMYDIQQTGSGNGDDQKFPASTLFKEGVCGQVSIVQDGLEMYEEEMTAQEENEVFMEQSEEVYRALARSCWHPSLHTTAVTFDDL